MTVGIGVKADYYTDAVVITTEDISAAAGSV